MEPKKDFGDIGDVNKRSIYSTMRNYFQYPDFCNPVTQLFSDVIWFQGLVNTDSGNGLVPGGTQPLSDPMLILKTYMYYKLRPLGTQFS